MCVYLCVCARRSCSTRYSLPFDILIILYSPCLHKSIFHHPSGSTGVFDIASLWDTRIRNYYADRFDARVNVIDWDYSQRVKVVSPIIHAVHYRRFRCFGQSYEPRTVGACTHTHTHTHIYRHGSSLC